MATYVRRYASPLMIADLFRQSRLGELMEERQLGLASVLIADVRGFTTQTMDLEHRGRNLRAVAELLENFFRDALATVFEHHGLMGEFSGDQLLAVFGFPDPKPSDADNALRAAVKIHNDAADLGRAVTLNRQYQTQFEIGIGLNTGGPVWIGDIGSSWRRELTMIGTTINLASRVEELTKSEQSTAVEGLNILLTLECLDHLSPALRRSLSLHAFDPVRIRGLRQAP